MFHQTDYYFLDHVPKARDNRSEVFYKLAAKKDFAQDCNLTKK